MRYMKRRLCSVMTSAALCLIPLASAWEPAPPPAPAARLPHPHFPKTLVCEIPKGPTITVKHLTVTFDRDGAAKMAPGTSWHLAGATFETDSDLVVGGRDVAAGRYALSARKLEGGWQLALHRGKGFSRPGPDALLLDTDFVADSLMFDHLNCDIQPGGNKQHTQLFLDVRFDKMLARCLIELPKK